MCRRSLSRFATQAQPVPATLMLVRIHVPSADHFVARLSGMATTGLARGAEGFPTDQSQP